MNSLKVFQVIYHVMEKKKLGNRKPKTQKSKHKMANLAASMEGKFRLFWK